MAKMGAKFGFSWSCEFHRFSATVAMNLSSLTVWGEDLSRLDDIENEPVLFKLKPQPQLSYLIDVSIDLLDSDLDSVRVALESASDVAVLVTASSIYRRL
jgi:hypothetical protein